MFLLAPRPERANAGTSGFHRISTALSETPADRRSSPFEVVRAAPGQTAPSEIANDTTPASVAPTSGFRLKEHDAEWQVLPHGPIQRLSENVWRVEGELPHFHMRRVMTIAKMSDGRLVIHSPIALDETSMAQIAAWGTPAFLLVPHSRHRMDAPRFKARYPWIKVLATEGALDKARAVVPVDGTYEDFPEDDAVSLRMLRGVGQAEGAMLVRSRDGVTVVLNEVVFNLPRPNGFAERAALTLLGLGPGPRVTSVVKAELVRDKEALRADLEDLANTRDLTRLIVSHHVMAEGAAAALCLDIAAKSL